MLPIASTCYNLKGNDMSFLITIKYRAIKYDNHQGGSGLPFEDKHSFLADSAKSLGEVEAEAFERLENICGVDPCEKHIGMTDVISIEIETVV